MSSQEVDVAIVGGGPAGMSAALVAGRARLRAVVVNEEKPRNRVTRASHGFLTRDGVHPLEMLEIAKSQLKPYSTIEYRAARVLSARSEGGAFRLALDSGGEIRAARVVVATGHRDDLDRLALPGIHEVYGTSVFPCPFCDGYERSDERLAVFGGVGVEQHAAIVKMWSDDVAVFTNGRALPEDARAALARNGVKLDESRVVRLESDGGRLTAVTTSIGRTERDAGFLWEQPGVPASAIADELGVRRTTNPRGITVYETDEMGATHVPRVYVVGDMRTGFSKVAGAASEGAKVVERIVHEIARERWR